MNNVIPNKTGWPLDKEKERERATAAAALASRHRRVPDSPATMTPASELAGISRATSPPAASGRGDTREAGAPRKDVRSTTRPGSKPLVEDDLDIFGTSGSSTWADQVEEETPEAVCNSVSFLSFSSSCYLLTRFGGSSVLSADPPNTAKAAGVSPATTTTATAGGNPVPLVVSAKTPARFIQGIKWDSGSLAPPHSKLPRKQQQLRRLRQQQLWDLEQ